MHPKKRAPVGPNYPKSNKRRKRGAFNFDQTPTVLFQSEHGKQPKPKICPPNCDCIFFRIAQEDASCRGENVSVDIRSGCPLRNNFPGNHVVQESIDFMPNLPFEDPQTLKETVLGALEKAKASIREEKNSFFKFRPVNNDFQAELTEVSTFSCEKYWIVENLESIKQVPSILTFQTDLCNLILRLRSSEAKNAQVPPCKVGDAEIRSENITRLMASPTKKGSGGWLDDEVINAATSLGKKMDWTKNVFVMNSQFMQAIFRRRQSYAQTNNRNEYNSSLNRLARKAIKKRRKGQINDLDNADIVIAPVLVGGNHWISVIADLKRRSVITLNSLSESTAKDAHKYVVALTDFLTSVELQSEEKMKVSRQAFEYQGQLRNYPTQSNHSDCGVFTILGTHAVASGSQPAVDKYSILKWRKYIAYLILSNATWR